MTTMHSADLIARVKNEPVPVGTGMHTKLVEDAKKMSGRLRAMRESDGREALDGIRRDYTKTSNELRVMQESKQFSRHQRRIVKEEREKLEGTFKETRHIIDMVDARSMLRQIDGFVEEIKKSDMVDGKKSFFDMHMWITDTVQNVRALIDYGKIGRHMEKQLSDKVKFLRKESTAKYREYGVTRPYVPRAESILQKMFNVTDFTISSLITGGVLASGGYALYTLIENAADFLHRVGPTFGLIVAIGGAYYLFVRGYVLKAIREAQNPKGELFAN